MTEQMWFKPSQIFADGLILDLRGHKNYRYILRLIKTGKLKAKVWTENGKDTEGAKKRPYYLVHRDEIDRFNKENYDER